jgi:ParB-like chromosome segregation protein Spo0J
MVILDGWHRLKACQELKIPCPAIFYMNLNEEQKKVLSRDPNAFRRFLTKKQQQETILGFRDKKWGYGRIAKAFGLSKSTAQRWFNEAEGKLPSKTSDSEKNLKNIIASFTEPHKALDNYLDKVTSSVEVVKKKISEKEKFDDEDKDKLKSFMKDIIDLMSRASEWEKTVKELLGE